MHSQDCVAEATRLTVVVPGVERRLVRRERAARGFLSLFVRDRVSWVGVRWRGLDGDGGGGVVGMLVLGLASVVVKGAGRARVIVGGDDDGVLSAG